MSAAPDNRGVRLSNSSRDIAGLARQPSRAPHNIGGLGVVVPIGALDRQIEIFQRRGFLEVEGVPFGESFVRLKRTLSPSSFDADHSATVAPTFPDPIMVMFLSMILPLPREALV